MKDGEWYIRRDGLWHGPYTRDYVLKEYENGRIDAKTLVECDGVRTPVGELNPYGAQFSEAGAKDSWPYEADLPCCKKSRRSGAGVCVACGRVIEGNWRREGGCFSVAGLLCFIFAGFGVFFLVIKFVAVIGAAISPNVSRVQAPILDVDGVAYSLLCAVLLYLLIANHGLKRRLQSLAVTVSLMARQRVKPKDDAGNALHPIDSGENTDDGNSDADESGSSDGSD